MPALYRDNKRFWHGHRHRRSPILLVERRTASPEL